MTGIVTDAGSLINIPYKPTTVVPPTTVSTYPALEIPVDNPLTKEGIALGRKLFYDPILSKDSMQSCSSCHKPELSFTDNMPTSKGVDGFNGRRSSMNLLDAGFQTHGLFWDGRVNTLEEQALKPVEDPLRCILHGLRYWRNQKA